MRIPQNSRLNLLATTGGVVIGVFGLEAAAQPQPLQTVPEGEGEELEEIVVLGSRIARDPNAIAPVPVQVISGDDIMRSGKVEAAEVLRENPALLTSVSSQESIDSEFSTSVGQSVLQLRGLGTERTLVLVNGRRHVAGVEGSQAVDVGSIPAPLIERVEVLTGGASALYGADAVTGVVNFHLKEDFEGFQLDGQASISDQGDADTYFISGVYGLNFDDERGNLTVAVDFRKRDKIRVDDRAFSRNNGIANRDFANPALRFQRDEIDPATTPNFAQFFNIDNGRFPFGMRIPGVEDFVADFESTFGAAPNLTEAERALIDRAANAPSRALLPQPVFSISSNLGLIAPGDFSSPDIDVDGNGVPDCQDSFVGFNSSFDFTGAFGAIGGCWVVDENGNLRPFNDGLVASDFNQFGGDGIPGGEASFNPNFLTPDDEKVNVNIFQHYDIRDGVTFFLEAKYSHIQTKTGGLGNGFYDLLPIAPDNPFIPDELVGLAQDTGGLFVNKDPTDLGPNIGKYVDRNKRETWRIVFGFEGEIDNGWEYELSGNFGKFERKFKNPNAVVIDRWLAAIDVTTDANGNPICRSDIDPTPPPGPFFDIPTFDPGFFTFNPGDGQCKPANILGGPNSISAEAAEFITTTVRNKFELEQNVISGFITGDSEPYFTLPAGPVGFSAGGEYRDEKSRSTFDPLELGVLPVDGPEADAGTLLTELPEFRQNSLVFDPRDLFRNSGGSFDVWELFAEVSVPILKDLPFIKDLRGDAAFRFSQYSTIDTTITWKASGSWTIVDDFRVRGTFSKAVRAPNISELFDPAVGAQFRPVDPCDQAQIDALKGVGDPRGEIRDANCRAAGIPEGFVDPLSARFNGVRSGNPDLEEESAKTITVGFVSQPRFIPGLTITADYWDIEIEDAIADVEAQDIANNCFDSENFPDNQFCDLFSRNMDPSSPQFLGLNFLRQTKLNFGSIASSGIDFVTRYDFGIGQNSFNVSVNGTFTDKLNLFFDPGDPNAVDPELRETRRPAWAVTGTLNWTRGPFTSGWSTRFQSEQTLRGPRGNAAGVEIETFEPTFGKAGIKGGFFVHDLNFGYDLDGNYRVFGGINNVADRKPFRTQRAFPVTSRGRSFFLGVTALF